SKSSGKRRRHAVELLPRAARYVNSGTDTKVRQTSQGHRLTGDGNQNWLFYEQFSCSFWPGWPKSVGAGWCGSGCTAVGAYSGVCWVGLFCFYTACCRRCKQSRPLVGFMRLTAAFLLFYLLAGGIG